MRRHVPVARHACVFTILLAALLCASPAQAQLFDDGEPTGLGFLPLRATPGMSSEIVLGCAPLQNSMTAYSVDGGAIRGMGPGLFAGTPDEYTITTVFKLAALPLPGVATINGLPGIVSDESRQHLYIATQTNPTSGGGGGPVLKYRLADDTAEVAVTREEQDAVTGGFSWVRALIPAGEDRLVVLYKSNGQKGTLAAIDLAKPEGQRVSVLLTADQLVAGLPEARSLTEWRGAMTADDKGRLFLSAFVNVLHQSPGATEPSEALACVVARFDPSLADAGRLVEMTGYEVPDVDILSPLWNENFPCFGVASGLSFDPDTGFLVGHGNGLWLLDPDLPRFSHMVLSQQQLLAAAQTADPKVSQNNNGVLGGCGCLAPLGGGMYGAVGPMFYDFVVDEAYLDLDADGLKGWQEAAYGTDSRAADTDGGGVSDGMEVVDLTDPRTPGDDRDLGDVPAVWTMGGQYHGSPFASGFSGASESRFGVAFPDGTLGVTTTTGSDASNLYVFRDWGVPAQPTSQKGAPGRMAVGPDGAVYGVLWEVSTGRVMRLTPDGGSEVVFQDQQLGLLMDAKSAAAPASVAVDPTGRVWAGFSGGFIVRTVAGGGLEKVYDAKRDMVAEGWFNEDGTNAIEGCQVDVSVSALVYEPVHGIVYFGLDRGVYCSGGSGTSPVLGAILPDGTFRRAGNGIDWRRANEQFGGGSFKDLEPDGKGGVWVLLAHLLDRSLTHFDASWTSREISTQNYPWTPAGATVTGECAHADDLMVLPNGRIFTSPADFFNQYPTTYGLAELRPVDAVVRGGEFVTVNPGARGLGKVLAGGGGLNFVFEGPLKAPTDVAATEEVIAVADAAAGGVLRFPVSAEGAVGEGKLVGTVQAVGGVAIDADGSILATDAAANRVVRIAADGAQMTVAQGAPLQAPMGLAVMAGGAIVVANSGDGTLQRIAPDGTTREVGKVAKPCWVSVAPGKAYVVASCDSGTALDVVDGDGTVRGVGPRFLGRGGAAAGDDGAYYRFVSQVGGALPVPFPNAASVVRIAPDGTAWALLRQGYAGDTNAGTVSRIRARDEALPAEPGGGTVAPQTDAGGIPDAAGGDAGAGGTDAGAAGCVYTPGAGGCSAGAGRTGAGAALIVLVALAFLCVRRTARGHRAALVALAFALGCSTGEGSWTCPDGVSPTDPGTSSPDAAIATDPGAWPDVGTLPPVCTGTPECALGEAPECVGTTARRRCLPGPDGCGHWSATVACPAGQACKEGACDACVPDCLDRACGDDGCGGSCGACTAPDVCCGDRFCGACVADCAGRKCGPDGAGGSCGACLSTEVCSDGACVKAATGGCHDFFEVCMPACKGWDLDCVLDCTDLLAPQSKQLASALYGCVDVRCSACGDLEGADFDACINECIPRHCTYEFSECYAEKGSGDCTGIYKCIGGCAAGDASCMDACYVSGWPWALSTSITLELCAGCYGLPPEAIGPCIREKAAGDCLDPYTTCFGACTPDCGSKTCGLDPCGLPCGGPCT